MRVMTIVHSPVEGPVGRAVRHTIPLCVALAPVGWLLGITISLSPVDGVVGWAGGPLVASGAAHFAMLDTLDQGAGLFAAWLAAVVLSSRCVLYSAALAPQFSAQPRWFRWVGPYFLIDQLYVMIVQEMGHRDDPNHFRRYYLTVGTIVVLAWAAAIAAGMAVGPVIPASWRVELIIVALVVAMLRPVVQTRSGAATATVGLIGALAASGLPLGTGLLVGSAAGIATGSWTERRR